MTNQILPATPGGVHASAAGYGHGREATGTACPATITTSTRSFEMRPYRPSCDVHGCPDEGKWILGSFGFRTLGDERCIGKFCAEHGMERLGALDPLRFTGGTK